ncbi:hypothetical protein B0H12DRAFT_1257770 [Mycena haematopus]|nr:hypothetical protein B0H12DRAFT_1257770 [Mycena haematopus]
MFAQLYILYRNAARNPFHMPAAKRVASARRESVPPAGVGGAGGVGLGPSFSTNPVAIDSASIFQIPELDTIAFCEEHQLGDEICALLDDNGFDTINSYLLVEEEAQLKELGFKVGHIAELRWAVKKLAQNFSTLPTANTQESYIPSIYGGYGGTGGDGLQRGGQGGTGKPPQLGLHDAWRFGPIFGGTGGTGGAGGPVPSFFGVNREVNTAANGGTASKGPVLNGGWGGTGGWGTEEGGVGGLGGGPRISVTEVGVFREIKGGIGGTGGASAIEGGSGGTGDGPILAGLLVSIDDETRRRLPYKKLEDMGIKPALCQLLKEQGFQSAGGLFEVHETDLPPQFKLGHVAGLKLALKKFAAAP